MGTLNLSSVVKNPDPVGEVDFSLFADLPSKFDINPLQRSNRVSVRLRSEDIRTLENLALEEGLPFQAFLGSIIHKFAAGNLK